MERNASDVTLSIAAFPLDGPDLSLSPLLPYYGRHRFSERGSDNVG